MTSTPLPEDSADELDASSALRTFAHPAVTAFMGLAAVALVLGRFGVSSPMWLDEALSVNIAGLPIGDIPEALKHDGHPPLYYVLLHGWMELFGTGTGAARSLSAVISIATLPLAYLTGKRIGGHRLGLTLGLLLALSPYAFRFGSETRMYSLLTLEAFAAFLLVTAAMRRPKPLTLIGVAAVVAAGLWTQYWALWLIATGGATVLWTAWQAHRRSDSEAKRASLLTAAAMVAGGVLFLPWLPTMLYQNEHTGTPWAPAFRPTTLVVSSLAEFGGGAYSEAQLGTFVLVVLVVIGIFGAGINASSIELRSTPRSDSILPLVLLGGTVAIASAVSLVNGMAFAPRYASGFFPFFLLLVALGIDRFGAGNARNVALVAVTVFSMAGVFFVLRLERSQVGVAADTITERSANALVIACPDQLGPSTARELVGDGYEVVAYPRLDDPRFVDWVDYAEHNAKNDPVAFAEAALELAGDRPLYMVYGDQFLTLEGQCQRVVEVISASRGVERLVSPSQEEFYEPVTLVEFGPRTN